MSDHKLTHHSKKKPAAVKMTKVMMKIPKILGTTTQSLQNNKKMDTTDNTQNSGPNQNKTQYNNWVQTQGE